MTKVLVTDADQRVALSVVRALDPRRYQTTAAEQATVRSPLCFASRYVARRLRLGQDVFAEMLCRAQAHDVLLPISTNTIHGVLCRERRFREASRMLLPDRRTFERVNNKAELARIAIEMKIDLPRTLFVEGEADLRQVQRELGLPLVLKLQDDIGLSLPPALRYVIVRRETDLRPAYWALTQHKPGLVAQEYIHGDTVGFAVVLDESGREKAIFCHQRLREYPLSGGPSTLCQSIRDQRLIETGLRLLKHAHWIGPAMVEFKREKQSGQLKLLEVNPRFWGTLPLAVRCGVNFPDIVCRLALGEDVPPVRHYAVGVKMRFLLTDTLGCLQALKRGGFQKVIAYVRDIADVNIHPGIFAWDDMRPALRYLFRRCLTP